MFQQMTQEIDHLLASHTAQIHLHPQLEPLRFGGHQQCTDQVHPLLMLQAGAESRRLPAWGPSALEWADQRFATFIEENQGCAQGLPLFLSTATDNVSNKRSRRHRVESLVVEAFGNSNLAGLANTRRYWFDTGRQSACESTFECASVSSNRRDSHPPARHPPRLASSV